MANNQPNEGHDTDSEGHLPENTIEYSLFILDTDSQSVSRNTLASLEAIRKAALQLSQSFTKDYIWQRGEFNLELKNDQGLVYLHGITDYADAVEDEWLIVYMLRELTKSHSDLWARVADADGEFLLVEAANVLPKWLSPEMDQHRVWIHDGKMVIIPATGDGGASPSRNLTLPQAVDFLKRNPDALVHSSFIESEAFYRLEKYPSQIADSIHCSRVTIPRKLAYVLKELPKSVAPAVECFYLRDPVGLKPILSPSDPLTFAPDDLITTSVRFSKILFAQLKPQRFEVPPRWAGAFEHISEAPSSDNAGNGTTKLEAGMKLTCGFEILARTASKNNLRVVRELAIILEDLHEDGDSVLPSDAEIESWPNSSRDDDESWMDINYEDFERELEGKQARGPRTANSGFGDAQTQADLKKIVSRFESFLNDDDAGIDGAELDDMDMDNDEDEESDEDSEYEDKEVSFDEEAFSRMMREMMGLPSAESPPQLQSNTDAKDSQQASPERLSTQEEEDKEVQNLSSQMEAELKEHGALKLDAPSEKSRQLKGRGNDPEKRQKQDAGTEAADEDSEAEVDIDYNLARNLLESFKSQGGTAGPTGNLLGMMGFQLPRDEDDGEENAEGDNKPSRSSS